MHFTSVFVPAALSLASGCHAWAQAANGVWVANNQYHNIRGSTVHEACTTMNTQNVNPGGTKCSYWTNGVGQIFDGNPKHFDEPILTKALECSYQGNSVLCIK
ncbi:hypothetical protein Ct61P_02182 [Colletotrichum tofieldiae]|nr:hypothetical protein Ct61P_02182 [Colletotrichum tofieldiae]